MAHLIRIGNSQGIRIPKPVIKQAELEDKELVFKVVEEGLLIKPAKKARQGWEAAIKAAQQGYEEAALEQEWLDAPLVCEDDLEWE